MTWDAFYKWLEANGVHYNQGDVHYAGRGYWYPAPPTRADHEANEEHPTPQGPWILVERDREHAAAFVITSWGVSEYAEQPERAQAAVEQALMDFDRQSFGALPPGMKRMRRDEPGWKGEYLPRVIHGEPEAYKKQQERRRELDARPSPPPRKGTGPEYKGEALKLRGMDSDVTRQCDDGFHERCDNEDCQCACHARTETTFPKPCTCGRVFTQAQWERLALVGRQPVEADESGPAYTLEMRNCPTCKSTMSIGGE